MLSMVLIVFCFPTLPAAVPFLGKIMLYYFYNKNAPCGKARQGGLEA